MSDEADYDPDANVPVWVNVLIPILSVLLFLSTLVILFHTKKEIPIEKLEEMAGKMSLLNKCFTATCSDNESNTEVTSANTTMTSSNGFKTDESRKLRKSRSWHDIRRYDSISTLKMQNNVTGSDRESQSSVKRPYYFASQGTLVSFESAI